MIIEILDILFNDIKSNIKSKHELKYYQKIPEIAAYAAGHIIWSLSYYNNEFRVRTYFGYKGNRIAIEPEKLTVRLLQQYINDIEDHYSISDTYKFRNQCYHP